MTDGISAPFRVKKQMAYKITSVENTKADEIIEAEDYREESGWFVFTRFTPGDYIGSGQMDQVARIKSQGFKRIDLVQSN